MIDFICVYVAIAYGFLLVIGGDLFLEAEKIRNEDTDILHPTWMPMLAVSVICLTWPYFLLRLFRGRKPL